ncbi:DUF6483 family protein [Pontibacter sp. G13]|uniref:DUF6483 family protein n=1 Tax=Pontibacter sp. G13 TaxID=3074898 RepID=UPI00288BEA34|nr:DUF6483 family protein [Pontibacter sp. G13]WNJ18131.1 DUF6483 family protein [Pontibacter sp. G13]
MLQRDYFMRMIEEAAAVLAKLMGLQSKGLHDEAERMLEQTFEDFFGLTGDQIRQVEGADFIQFLEEQDIQHSQQLSAMAKMLRYDGEVAFEQGKFDRSRDSLQKALSVLEYLNSQEADLYDFTRIADIQSLEDLLKDIPQN